MADGDWLPSINKEVSQVFKSSIKSRPNAEEDGECCNVCGDWRFDDKMLLCDSCDRGFHLFCLNPALLEIPETEWHCPDCLRQRSKTTTTTTTTTPRRKRTKQTHTTTNTSAGDNRNDNDDVVVEFDDGEPCLVCSKWENWASMLLCDACDKPYHLSCLRPPLSHVPVQEWFCPLCDFPDDGAKMPKRKKKVQDDEEYDYQESSEENSSAELDATGEDDPRLEFDKRKLYTADELEGRKEKRKKKKKPHHKTRL